MAIFPTRFRVMTLCKFSPPFRSKPEYDQDDFEATIDLRQFLGEHLDTFCSDLLEPVKWFIDKLSLIRYDIDWVEREAQKVWPLLEGEYLAWVQIACGGRSADQDWRAPAWLDKWPADLPPKALLSAARVGRLDADRTARVLNEIANRIKELLASVQKSALDNLRVRLAHEKETARRTMNAFPKSPGSRSGKWSDSVTNGGDDKPAAPPSPSYNPYAEVHAKGLSADREKTRSIQRFLEPASREWQQHQETIDAIDDKLLELSERAKSVARDEPNSPNAVMADVTANTAPALPVKPKTKRGPKANMEFHRAVAEVVKLFGSGWKGHLDQIARRLDKSKRNFPTPAAWAKRDPPAHSWGRAVGLYPNVVLKKLEYSLEKAEKEIIEKPSETLGNLR
jgi:hypothetical protein